MYRQQGGWRRQVFVFGGQDGEFTLVEDDGITVKYAEGLRNAVVS